MRKRRYLLILILIIGVILSLIFREQKVAVLGYHSFYKYSSELKNGKEEYINNIKDFDKQMKYLKDHHYKTLSLDEFYCFKKGKCKIPRKSVVITIDDGNLSNYMYAFKVLKKYNFKASVFFVGFQAEKFGKEKGTIYDVMSLELIDRCKKEYPNIKFYSHSYNLHDKAVTEYSSLELLEDIKNMKKLGNYKYYAYPFGVYDDRMIKLLKSNGYKMAFGFGPKLKFKKAGIRDDDYKVPRLNISSNMSMLKFKLRLLSLY